jgi:DNA-binding transcriptional MerR regulator
MAALTVGQLARRAGTTPRALRHYDRLGLFCPDVVEAGTGVRRYTEDQLDSLLLIVSLRAVDLPLEEVRRCLAEPAGQGRDRLVTELLEQHRSRLQARLTRLQRAIHQLDHMKDGTPMSTTNDTAVDHRALGVELFNLTWTFLEKENRTADEDDLMVHTAHASAYHWRQVGTAANFARSEWQISRVYSVLGRSEPALHHARRCLQICQDNGIGDWDLGFAYEALARAAAADSDQRSAQEWANSAYAAAADIAEEEDRELLVSDLATIQGVSAPA